MFFATASLIQSLLLFTLFNKASVVYSMSSFDSQIVCPLTKQALPENALDTAVVFGVAVPSSKITTCGHACTMGALIDHIDDCKGAVKCPECETSCVISVCDASAAQKLCSDDESCDLIAFRYGQQVYRLTVPEISGVTTQDRIAHVLGIKDLQVLHHGKHVYPDDTKTEDEVSSNLLDICRSERGKKPTLIIMGKRTGRWGAQGGHIRR